MDINLIQRGKTLTNITLQFRELSDGRRIPYQNDNSVDMFTSVDLMDKASSHDSTLIPQEYLNNRNYLREIMMEFNFSPYSAEWWHYTLKNEPFPETYFDFDVQ